MPFDFDTLAKEEYIQGILHYSFKTSVRLYDISALMDLLNHTKGSYDKLYFRHIKILCKKYRREIILYLYLESKRYILNIGWILTHILGFRTDFLSRKYDTKEIIMNEFLFSPIGNLPSFPFTLLQLSILMSNTSYWIKLLCLRCVGCTTPTFVTG